MKLNNRPSLVESSKKRVGRGYGSGKGGHTTGRGQKGQKARYSIPIWFTGTSWVWFKRLPFLRGKSRFKSLHKPTIILTLSDLDEFKSGTLVDKNFLLKEGLLTKNDISSYNIKVLYKGKLTKKIKLALKASNKVVKEVEKLGGEYLGEAA